MKSKFCLMLAVVAVIVATLFSGAFVQAFDRFSTHLCTEAETGEVYRVQRRAHAHCDGTVVVRERRRLVRESCDADAVSCDTGRAYRGWQDHSTTTYSQHCN